MSRTVPSQTRGPYRVDDIRDGEPYELSNGHRIECMPGGRDHAGVNLLGARVIASDPDVGWAGVDAGYALSDDTLRAPDLAIDPAAAKAGPGWIPGAPPLAVEYAGVGQDLNDLEMKIGELFAAGTRLVWVIRLVGPQRVEVHAPGQAMKSYTAEEELHAPGILRNPIPVRALFEEQAGDRVALRNLLAREGYSGLDAVREEGREEGELATRRATILEIFAERRLEIDAGVREAIASCSDLETLKLWSRKAVTVDSAREILEAPP